MILIPYGLVIYAPKKGTTLTLNPKPCYGASGYSNPSLGGATRPGRVSSVLVG